MDNVIGVSQLTQIISVLHWFDTKRNAVMLHEAVHFTCSGVLYLHTLDHVTSQSVIRDGRIDFNLATVFCGRNTNIRKNIILRKCDQRFFKPASQGTFTYDSIQVGRYFIKIYTNEL